MVADSLKVGFFSFRTSPTIGPLSNRPGLHLSQLVQNLMTLVFLQSEHLKAAISALCQTAHWIVGIWDSSHLAWGEGPQEGV